MDAQQGNKPTATGKPDASTQAKPFELKECCILISPTGRMVVNLREFHQGLLEVDDEVVYHHMFRCHLKSSYVQSVFPNDFAIWCARALHDFALAEKLAAFDPYELGSLPKVRQVLVDTVEDHLSALHPHIPWAKEGFNFHFERSEFFVTDTGMRPCAAVELAQCLRQVDVSAIYYHFIDARLRETENRDDFTRWLEDTHHDGVLVEQIENLDFHLLTLGELRRELMRILCQETHVI